MDLRHTTGNEKGTAALLQAGTMNDEYLGSCFYSSFVIFNPSKVPAPLFSQEFIMQRYCDTAHENRQRMLGWIPNRQHAASQTGVQSRDRRERDHTA
jgi:hypothetical protein